MSKREIHVPTTPFANARVIPGGAYDVVASMSEDQVRYALWSTLVLCFGAQESNAPEIVTDYKPNNARVAEAQLILIQVGVGSTMPEEVAAMKAYVADMLANE